MISWLRGNVWRLLALLVLVPVYFVVEVWDDLPDRWEAVPKVRDVKASQPFSHEGVTWRLNRFENPRQAVDSKGKPLPPRKDGLHYAVAYFSFKASKGGKLATSCDTRLSDPEGRIWETGIGNPADVGLDVASDCLNALDGKNPVPGRWYTFVNVFFLPKDASNLTPEVALGRRLAGERREWARFVS